MPTWKSDRDSRRSALSRIMAGDRKLGLPPLKNQGGVPPEEQASYANRDLTGTVVWFDGERQFGFAQMADVRVQIGSRGVFVHNEEVLQPRGARLKLGTRIKAGVIQTAKGPRAVNIRIM